MLYVLLDCYILRDIRKSYTFALEMKVKVNNKNNRPCAIREHTFESILVLFQRFGNQPKGYAYTYTHAQNIMHSESRAIAMGKKTLDSRFD